MKHIETVSGIEEIDRRARVHREIVEYYRQIRRDARREWCEKWLYPAIYGLAIAAAIILLLQMVCMNAIGQDEPLIPPPLIPPNWPEPTFIPEPSSFALIVLVVAGLVIWASRTPRQK